MAMNRILGATDRLLSQVDTPYAALACSTIDQDTIFVVVPADDPGGSSGTISISISDLPWNTGTATRFELTMTDYATNPIQQFSGQPFIHIRPKQWAAIDLGIGT